MKAGPKAATDPSRLPFRARAKGAIRFAGFCRQYVMVPKGKRALTRLVPLEDETEPRALLTRAVRYAEDQRAPEPRRVRDRPYASRYGGSGSAAPAPGGVTTGGGC